MRFAMELSNQGKVVGWVDREATRRREDIHAEAADLGLHAAFVDDVEIFGTTAFTLLKDLNQGGER